MSSDSAVRLRSRCRGPVDRATAVRVAGTVTAATPCHSDLGWGVRVGPRIAGTKPPELIDDLVEPLALDQLHGVEAKIALTPNLEDRDDIGMVQPCRGSGLRGGIARELSGR